MPLTIFQIGDIVPTWIHPNKSIQLTFNDKSPTPISQVSFTLLNPLVKITHLSIAPKKKAKQILSQSQLNSVYNGITLHDIVKLFNSKIDRPSGDITIQFTNTQTSQLFEITLTLSRYLKRSKHSEKGTSSSTSRLTHLIYDNTCHAYIYSEVSNTLNRGDLKRLARFMDDDDDVSTFTLLKQNKRSVGSIDDDDNISTRRKKTKKNISMVNNDRNNNNNRRERNTQESDNTLKGEKLDNSVPQFENLLNDPIIYQYFSSLKYDNQLEFNMTSQQPNEFNTQLNVDQSTHNDEFLNESELFVENQQLDEPITYILDEGQINHDDELIIDVNFADSFCNDDDPFQFFNLLCY